MLLRIHVHPRAHKNAIRAWVGDVLHVNLRATPIKNEANVELLRFLSELLNVPKTSLRIAAGHTSRQKTVHIPPGTQLPISARAEIT